MTLGSFGQRIKLPLGVRGLAGRMKRQWALRSLPSSNSIPSFASDQSTWCLALADFVAARSGNPPAVPRGLHGAAVFQDPLLLRGTIAHNVGLGLALRGVSRATRRTRIESVLRLLRIAHLAKRSVATLSGGEAQRTSLARALVLDPEVLFLDEPFATLDQPTRRRLVREVAELLHVRRMATVIVTHDLTEATALCDRCAILDGGTILQDGLPKQVLEQPLTQRVAEIVGSEGIWDAPKRQR